MPHPTSVREDFIRAHITEQYPIQNSHAAATRTKMQVSKIDLCEEKWLASKGFVSKFSIQRHRGLGFDRIGAALPEAHLRHSNRRHIRGWFCTSGISQPYPFAHLSRCHHRGRRCRENKDNYQYPDRRPRRSPLQRACLRDLFLTTGAIGL